MEGIPVYKKVEDLVRRLEAKGYDAHAEDVIVKFSRITNMQPTSSIFRAIFQEDHRLKLESERRKAYSEEIAHYWLLLV